MCGVYRQKGWSPIFFLKKSDYEMTGNSSHGSKNESASSAGKNTLKICCLTL
jgi:hypothetical protein